MPTANPRASYSPHAPACADTLDNTINAAPAPGPKAPGSRVRPGAWLRGLHRVHRVSGTVFALWIALWFASGAVMTFVNYPSFSARERLAHAAPLPVGRELHMPAAVRGFLRQGGLATGARLRLAQLEGQPTWLFSHADRRYALRAVAPFDVAQLNEPRARAELERQFGACGGSATRLTQPDQWTVGRSDPGSYPLWKLSCGDRALSEFYLSARTGELVQHTTRAERVAAWFGPILHWVYPVELRRHAVLWRNVVLGLATLCLLVSLSGLCAGLCARIVVGRRRQSSAPAARDAYLRWHQRLGLGFGLFASTWLASGALSLEPFHWSGDSPSPRQLAALHAGAALAPESLPLTAALASCQRVSSVRELEITQLGGLTLAICSDAAGGTRLVDLADPQLRAQPRLPTARLAELGRTLVAAQGGFVLSEHAGPDAYYFATHRDATPFPPFVRLELADRDRTWLYLDPARAELVASFTDKQRLARWLFGGLHRWDFPGLYRQRWLWRGGMLVAMALGFTLASLGAAMALRRRRRGVFTVRPARTRS